MMNDSDVAYQHMDDPPPPVEHNKVVELCLKGYECPSPPCAPWCERKCECCCIPLARFGKRDWDDQKIRGPLMMSLSIVSFISIIIGIIGACGLSSSASTLKHCNWTHATWGQADIYFGLSDVSIEIPPNSLNITSRVVSWNQFCEEISDAHDEALETCKTCDDAAGGLTSLAVTGAISKLGQLSGDLTRSTRKHDSACQKVLSSVIPFISLISTMSALVTYGESCYDVLPSGQVGPFSFSRAYGPGFVCFIICTVLSVPDAIANLLTPVPEQYLLKYGSGSIQ